MSPLSAPSSQGALARLTRWTVPLLVCVAAGAAHAGELFQAKFRIFDKQDEKVFVLGVFDVILDDLVLPTSQASLPKAISFANVDILGGPLKITPTQFSDNPDYITWSGTSDLDPNVAQFSFFSPGFLQAATGQTWRSFLNLSTRSYDLAQGPPADGGYSVLIKNGVSGQTKESTQVLEFDASSVPPQVTPDTAAVPGPLPLAGAAVAFGFSRRLRKRISS